MYQHMKLLLIVISTFAVGAIVGVLGIKWWPSDTTTGSTAPGVSPPVVVQEKSCTMAEAYPGRSVDVDDDLVRSRPKFFPRSAADTQDRNFDPFQRDWYGKHLRALGETSLLEKAPADDAEAYRLTWLRTFDHPVVIRLEYNGYGASLISRETDGMGGYEPGKIIRTDTFQIGRQEWCRFIELLNVAEFWSMPSENDDDGGTDGSQWILEGIRGHRYHSVDRWTPSDGAYHDAGAYLIQLSGRDTLRMGSDFY
jgi:hypothetical protein